MKDLRDLRGVAYALGARIARTPRRPGAHRSCPRYEEVQRRQADVRRGHAAHPPNTNPFNAAARSSSTTGRPSSCNPPALPLSQERDGRGLRPAVHAPAAPDVQREPIPAYEMIKDSVTIMRGCFGGCTFCSITAHQGRIIQSRSQGVGRSTKLTKMAADPEFKGVVSDIGGPTANMYQMRCTPARGRGEVQAAVVRPPDDLQAARHRPRPAHRPDEGEPRGAGIRKVFVASGIRMDLAQLSPEYVQELAGTTSAASSRSPRSTPTRVLGLMKKPRIDNFDGSPRPFKEASKKAGKPKQFLVPYFIASHPGSDLDEMIDLAVFLKRNGYRPDQVQDFIPAPFDIATCMYYTGIDPFTDKPVYVASTARPQDAAGADAVLQAGELLHGAGGPAQGRAGRPDRQRLRLPDPGPTRRRRRSRRGGGRRTRRPRATITTRSPTRPRASRRRARPAEAGLPAGAEDSERRQERSVNSRRRIVAAGQ